MYSTVFISKLMCVGAFWASVILNKQAEFMLFCVHIFNFKAFQFLQPRSESHEKQKGSLSLMHIQLAFNNNHFLLSYDSKLVLCQYYIFHAPYDSELASPCGVPASDAHSCQQNLLLTSSEKKNQSYLSTRHHVIYLAQQFGTSNTARLHYINNVSYNYTVYSTVHLFDHWSIR